jgi:hypothetical protein
MTLAIVAPRHALALLTGLLAAACSSTGPGGGRIVRGPALLAFYGAATEVQVPTTVRVGVPFTVTATSFGGGCIARGETAVTVVGLTAEVRPYRDETVEVACSSELRLDQNAVVIQFDSPGEARIRIIGLARPGEQPYVVERPVFVSP